MTSMFALCKRDKLTVPKFNSIQFRQERRRETKRRTKLKSPQWPASRHSQGEMIQMYLRRFLNARALYTPLILKRIPRLLLKSVLEIFFNIWI